jgi:hypothetical protein
MRGHHLWDCSPQRSVERPPRAPRRLRMRPWLTVHLPLLLLPPPRLDGGPRPTSGTGKKETRQRRRRRPQDQFLGPPASSRRRGGPAATALAVEKPPPPSRPRRTELGLSGLIHSEDPAAHHVQETEAEDQRGAAAAPAGASFHSGTVIAAFLS